MKTEQIVDILTNEGFLIEKQERAKNNYGDVLKLENGCIINCYDKGTYNCQGKNTEPIQTILDVNAGKTVLVRAQSKKVFVVYGHDDVARVQLEAMLRRWDLEPLILDQLVSGGQTIIEKLEEYTNKVDFGIVLATPDDIGYSKNCEDKKKFRARQNVILELGMLLATIGRSKVAILLKASEDMENPSDIQGLIYIPFKDTIEETKLSLAKEMQGNGYALDISKL